MRRSIVPTALFALTTLVGIVRPTPALGGPLVSGAVRAAAKRAAAVAAAGAARDAVRRSFERRTGRQKQRDAGQITEQELRMALLLAQRESPGSVRGPRIRPDGSTPGWELEMGTQADGAVEFRWKKQGVSTAPPQEETRVTESPRDRPGVRPPKDLSSAPPVAAGEQSPQWFRAAPALLAMLAFGTVVVTLAVRSRRK